VEKGICMGSMQNNANIRISKIRKELLASYANAAGFLYSVLTISEFVDLFNNYEEIKTDAQEAILALKRYAEAFPYKVEYSLFDDFITGPTIQPNEFEEDIEELYCIREHQHGKPRFLPDKEEFLKFSDPLHIEPYKPYIKLSEYIYTKKLCTDENIGGIYDQMLDVYDMIQDGLQIKDILEFFIEVKGYIFNNTDEINEFLKVVMYAYNNTRMFENNGFTPNEMMEMAIKQPKEQVLRIPKEIGRNDPCFCGSGKKYKKCCYMTKTSRSAQLLYSERDLFYETWYKLLYYVNKKHKVVKYKFNIRYDEPKDEMQLHKIRDLLWEQPEIINDFIEDPNKEYPLSEFELSLLKSWVKGYIKGRFILMGYTPEYAILMHPEENGASRLYGVKGMTSSIAEITQQNPPIVIETVLLPFRDKIIYDSFIGSYPISYGDGAVSMFDELYSENLEKHGIITCFK